MAQVRADHHVVYQAIGSHFDPADGREQFRNRHGEEKFEIRNPKFEANSKFLLRPRLKSSGLQKPVPKVLCESRRKPARERTGAKRQRTAALQDAVATIARAAVREVLERGCPLPLLGRPFANSASVGDHMTGRGTSVFGFVSNFGFRISDFEFFMALPPH
jgi:hypothetical protein